tara:strand:+ start:697 stop:1737 length:1041 start_codon:yes stop_codon:yes gene_type:complete
MGTVLVTGGAGFIGSHTSVQLLKKGYDICILDSFINSYEITIKQIERIIKNNKSRTGNLFLKKGDLRNRRFLDEVFIEFRDNKSPFDGVIHFAGLKSVEESVNQPLKYYDFNLNSTLCLLEAMKKFKCYSLVFSSSATIYDPNHKGKFKENSNRNPINPYGNTKLIIEKILEDLSVSSSAEWKIANLRYFNPVGAHESSLIGENPLIRPTNLFPIIMKVAKREYDYLSIFGNDWPTKDGTCIRDYIHVMDLADAHLASLDYLMSNKPQIVSINIGTGNGTSVMEIVKKFIQVTKIHIPFKFENRRKGDPACLVADNSLSLELLKWKPKRDLSDMCFHAWEWERHKQ